MIQSTATDTDFLFLTDFAGYQAGQTVAYRSSTSSAGWTGMLSGSYLGMPLSVGYSGDLTAYPPGPVTWTDSGTYGAWVWTGSGSATITDTGPASFQLAISDSLMVGSNMAALAYTIPGTVLADGTILFGSAGGDEVGSGTGTINGLALANTCYSYRDAAMTMRSDIVIRPDDKPCDDYHTADNQYVRDNTILVGTISTVVPEPPPIFLLGAGLAGVLFARQIRQRHGRHA